MATLLPTNRPAPMMPPIEIIAICLGRSDRLSCCDNLYLHFGLGLTIDRVESIFSATVGQRNGARQARSTRLHPACRTGAAFQCRRRDSPPDAARAVSSSSGDSLVRSSFRLQRLVGPEMLMAATGR